MSSAASACLDRSRPDRRQPEQRAPERRAVPRFERELHGVAHGELREQASRPGTCGRARARPLVRALRLTSVPEELRPCPATRHVAADRVQQRRLAGAVVADEPDRPRRASARKSTSSTATRPPNCTVRRVRREHAAVGVRASPGSSGATRVSDAGGAVDGLRRSTGRQPLLDPAQQRVAARSSRSARSRRGCTAG